MDRAHTHNPPTFEGWGEGAHTHAIQEAYEEAGR